MISAGDQMQLLFSDRYYDSAEWEEGKFLREIASELATLDPRVEAYPAQIGHGADFPSVLVELFRELDWSTLLTVAGAGGLFLAGERINKSIEGWLGVAEKVQTLIRKFKPIRIDESAAVLIVLNDLGPEAARGLITLTVQIEPFDLTPWNEQRLSKRPDALYIITARAADTFHVYGLKSNGRVVFKHEFAVHWYEFEMHDTGDNHDPT
jgi:hypothetical protein